MLFLEIATPAGNSKSNVPKVISSAHPSPFPRSGSKGSQYSDRATLEALEKGQIVVNGGIMRTMRGSLNWLASDLKLSCRQPPSSINVNYFWKIWRKLCVGLLLE